MTPLFGGSDFGELLIGFHVGDPLELLNSIPLPHVQLLDASLLDLLPQIRQGETQQPESAAPSAHQPPQGLSCGNPHHHYKVNQ